MFQHTHNVPYNQTHQHVSYSNNSDPELLSFSSEIKVVSKLSQSNTTARFLTDIQSFAGGQKHCELDINYKSRHLEVRSFQLSVQ